MISSHVKISCLITFLFCWCMIEMSLDLLQSSSAIFSNLRKMSGNDRKMLENVRPAFVTILENLRKPPESGRKSSKNRQKWRHQHDYISFAALTYEISFLPLEHKIHILSPPCNILYLLPFSYL